ncbi:MAG: TonB family protein [Elusimicrobiota bacterium]
MNQNRLPAAISISVALHAAALGFFLYSLNAARKSQPKIISNVDLLIQVNQPRSLPANIPRAAPTTWNFLKLALPALPSALPKAMSVKMPETPRPLMAAAPKLQDRGLRKPENQMKPLDLNTHRALEAKNVEEHLSTSHGIASLAQLPRLEDVGERRIANLPQALKIDDQRRRARAMQVLAAEEDLTQHENLASQAPAPLNEAASPRLERRSSFANPLPQAGGISLAPQPQEAPAPSLGALPLPDSSSRKAALAGRKKSLQIEGPLANRKVLSYVAPAFPRWASEAGILEASVAIKFWVSQDGAVQSDMSIERTSGYGRLDRLAIRSLAKWKFAPIDTNERQWGIITFRFILE